MRSGWRGGLRTVLAGSLLFGGTIVASVIAESPPASAASVVQPIATGSTRAEKPVIAPAALSRSTRRFTAGADSPTSLPMTA